MEYLRCMQLNRMINSLTCPKLKGSCYSGLYFIIKKVSGKLGTSWCIQGLYHSLNSLSLVNTELLKKTAIKFVQPLLQKKTLSLLSWKANRSALCLRDRHYLYLPKLFAKQTYLKIYFRTEVVSVSAQKTCRKAKDLYGIGSQ